MTIQFTNVGRDKKNWEVEMKEMTSSALLKSIKKNRALGSKLIEFDYDPDFNEGVVYVGGFMQVGTFKVKEKSESA